MVLRLGCSLACGIFLDQGSSPCPSHWQVGSYPLHHLGSPRETVLSGHGSTATLPSRKYPLIPSNEGAGKTPISQVLPGRGLTTCFPSCCLQVQLLISRSATGLSATLPSGTVTGLAHTQLPGATENKGGGLDSHRRLRDNGSPGQSD